MAQWARIKFYYSTMLGSPGSVLAADSTDTGGDYSVDYIHNMLETNQWRSAGATSPQHITYDAGAGNAGPADYLVILGHNLNSAGATVALQYSTDNFASDINDAFVPEIPAADTVYIKEFTSPGPYRYWRLRISGASSAPYMAVCVWGAATELDYATAGFDPHGEKTHATVNLSAGGFVTGVHERYTERVISLRFADADQALYDRIKLWRETSGLKNFFLGWERSGHPDEVYLVRPDASFRNPFSEGGLYRDITLRLRGRKES